ncbi:hypothetical protein KM176_22275 [Pseudooceanicola sp. CBS1P-1]|uniref:Uncharacterized protein n=1 Tax=Pseudooceanicola albus TaxID=2692189 RepID=A0A6L7GB10_9RHOB|nr:MULTISPECIES: hypothetical protein [Pseudooceanicola]MBT9386602.1 hypothetical protein [Pseudooceanicola endophyticus]MXN20718.1 hypothetical protein [Pseudooceanicola albus]
MHHDPKRLSTASLAPVQATPNSLNDRELATILAALRYWQRTALLSTWGTDSPEHGYLAGQPTCPEGDIATEGGLLAPMDQDEIDRLIERING